MSKIIVDQIQKLAVASSPTTLTVTNSGSGAYTINAANNPTLTLVRGSTYTFNINATGHPFHIQTVTGAYSSGNLYTTGVTNAGAQTGTITFVVPAGAPSTLYYVCQNHSVMRGTINVINATTATFNIPATDGTSGQYMKTDGSGNLGWSSMTNPYGAAPIATTGIPVAENKGMIGSIVSRTDRQQNYSTGEWTSTGPNGSYYNYTLESDPNAVQMFNMALGDGKTAGTSEIMYGGDSEKSISRTLEFTNGYRLGWMRDFFHYDNTTDYAGHTWRILPIRNTSSSAINVAIYAYASNYWSSGYEGCQLVCYVPTNSVNYSAVSSVTATNLGKSSSNSKYNGMSGSISVPANTTILAVISSTDYYTTTYRFWDTNFFYYLDTTFSNPSIICDMRMLHSLHTTRFNMSSTGTIAAALPALWKQTAVNYGDR